MENEPQTSEAPLAAQSDSPVEQPPHKPRGGSPPGNWPAIDPEVLERAKTTVLAMQGDYAAASDALQIPAAKLKQWAHRYKWPTPARVAKIAKKKSREIAAATGDSVAEQWATKGEEHRQHVFNIAKRSLAKVKKVSVRTAKDLEIVDKVGRRAAGLDTADINQQTLIQINENIDAYEQPIEDDGQVIDAEVIEEPAAA